MRLSVLGPEVTAAAAAAWAAAGWVACVLNLFETFLLLCLGCHFRAKPPPTLYIKIMNSPTASAPALPRTAMEVPLNWSLAAGSEWRVDYAPNSAMKPRDLVDTPPAESEPASLWLPPRP